MTKPDMPQAQIVYGEVIYWLCIIAAAICTIGPLISLWFVDNNVLNPHFVFAALWEGKSAETIWNTAGEGFPGGHFFLYNITTGDGFTQFGIALGSIAALPALFMASIAYLRERPRNYLYAILSLWVMLLIAFASAGIIATK